MSKEKLLLIGAGGFGRMVAEQAMLQYDCAFVDDGQPVGTEICGIPVVGGLTDLPELRKATSQPQQWKTALSPSGNPPATCYFPHGPNDLSAI